MESTNNRFKSSLLQEEDDHLSSFRKRNNRLIITLFSLIILVGLILGAIIISLSHRQYMETSNLIHSNPAVNSFCSYTYFPFDCSNSLNFKIKPESKTDPNQLFSLSLDIAIEELTSITPPIDNQTESAFKNCSSLVQKSLSRLSQTLAIFRVNPDMRSQTDEQRSDMINLIFDAKQDLSSCCDDLAKIESTAVRGIRAGVDQAKIYLNFRDCWRLRDVGLQGHEKHKNWRFLEVHLEETIEEDREVGRRHWILEATRSRLGSLMELARQHLTVEDWEDSGYSRS